MRIELKGEWDRDEIQAGLRAATPVPLWAQAIAPGLVVTAYALFRSGGSLTLGDVITIALISATVGLVMVIVITRRLRKMVDVPSFTGPVAGAITDEAVSITTSDSLSTVPWSRFRSMKFNHSAAALMTRQRTCMLVLRNWFPDQESWDTFTAAGPALVDAESPVPEPTPEPEVEEGALVFGGPFSPAEHRPVMARMSPARRYGIAVSVLGAALTAVTLLAMATGTGSAGFLPVGLLAITFGPLILYGIPALSTRIARRGEMARGVSGTADDTGIHLRYGTGASDVGWASFIDVIRTDRAVGLMLTPQAGIVIVRSWFDSDIDWQRFVALVLHHVEVRRRRRFGPL